MSDHKKGNANSRASARGGNTERPLLLPADAIIRIELEVEERVRQSITQLVTSPEWVDILRRRSRPPQFDTDTRQQRRELLLIVESFARKYKKLLEGAVVEFCREIGQACREAGHPGTPADAEHAWQRGCQFAERFTMGDYAEPWGGFFMLKPSPTACPTLRDDEADEETIAGEFQEARALATLFDDVARCVRVAAEAEGLTEPQYVWREYARHAHGWKNDSASRAKNQFLIVAPMPKESAHAGSPPEEPLEVGATPATDSSPAKAETVDLRPNQLPKSWQEIEIAFLSDERVEICCGVVAITTIKSQLQTGGRMELTTSQAVQLYRVFPSVLHRMILMGRLEARKDENGRWLISKESLERWNRQRVRRGQKQQEAIASTV